MKKKVIAFVACALSPAVASATFVVNDNFLDGRSDAGPLQADWFASSTGNAIEYNAGANTIGLVSGTSGRQIHGLFPTVTLANVGDILRASVTFTTPDTIDGDGNGSEDFKFGLFDHLGRDNPSQLRQDTSYSSGSPNPDYNGIPGYMTEIDVDPATITNQDIQVRRSDPSNTGRLLSTNTGFSTQTSGPDLGYVIMPNTQYVVGLEIVRTATGLDVTSTFLMNSHTFSDASPNSFNFNMVGLGSSSNAFGTNNTPGDPDNGIDISNFTVEYFAIPEPSTSALLLGALVAIGLSRRRK